MKLVSWSRASSPWLLHLNTGGCNACDIEILAALDPRFDVERFGVLLKGSPRHADVLVVTGPVNRQVRDRVIRVYEQMAEPSARANGTDMPARYKVRAPTSANLAPLIQTMTSRGRYEVYVADIPVLLAGIDPCMCCMDRSVKFIDDSKGKEWVWTMEQLKKHTSKSVVRG